MTFHSQVFLESHKISWFLTVPTAPSRYYNFGKGRKIGGQFYVECPSQKAGIGGWDLVFDPSEILPMQPVC